ncbi:unnamed protein product [Clonostachys byssicola]|uniref:FAD/NAD(P)-binding domain-containing protein n=1 Tax=Clonostachys byssicola TaxID=160290 RepID=A0A9N9UZR1_9HYPO|nr:unnamed protein product [Clonostachys byssicola]
MFENIRMYARVAAFIFAFAGEEIRNIAGGIVTRQQARWFGSTPYEDRKFNIVIVGASFAGHQVARIIANNLPPRSPYRVIVIEPSSHFVFTWVLPRYCVAKGHEHKAFVPYGGYTDAAPDGSVRWIKDRVVSITKESVELQDSKEVIPYSYLVMATGSNVKYGLPSRVHETEKSAGMKLLQEMQQDVEKSQNLVVVGGGAAGVEVATDAKAKYPDKKVTLVHSRNALMHRFGEKLHVAALEGTEKLGVEVILEDRVVGRNEISKTVHLKSGRELECDFMINCVGQKPSSDLIAQLSPTSISTTGHIKVRPTLQVEGEGLSNIYACGDVADTKTPNPNARSAGRQAGVVARNILLEAQGGLPDNIYENHWGDGVIKLTLGLDRSVGYIGDDKSGLLFESREKAEELMAAGCWRHMGKKPYEDDTKLP